MFGLPRTDCQEGFGYPAQVPLTTPDVDGAPVGPPLPPEMFSRKEPLAVRLLQRLVEPKVVVAPAASAISWLAHESFQGISGT